MIVLRVEQVYTSSHKAFCSHRATQLIKLSFLPCRKISVFYTFLANAICNKGTVTSNSSPFLHNLKQLAVLYGTQWKQKRKWLDLMKNLTKAESNHSKATENKKIKINKLRKMSNWKAAADSMVALWLHCSWYFNSWNGLSSAWFTSALTASKWLG